MRIVLVGTVESTVVTLRAFVAAGHAPVAVVTLLPDLADRHGDFVDMAAEARSLGVNCVTVRSINAPDVVDAIAGLEPDWLVVVGWSQIVHPPLLAVPRVGSIGYHPSPLPRLRGRAVLAWTILLGLDRTAGTLFKLEPGVDSGHVLAQRKFAVSARETLATLISKHMEALDAMWRDLIPRMIDGAVAGEVQDEAAASYCGKRTADDGRIDWTQPVVAVDRLVRAVTRPYPGAFTWRADDRLTIWRAEPWQGPVHYGPPGQVLAVGEADFLVACRLGETLRVMDWSWGNPETARPLRVGERLGAAR